MISNNSIAVIVLALVVLGVSITVHEFMHGLVGYWLGDDTAKMSGRLTLNPVAHVDLYTTILLPLLLIWFGLPPFGAAKPVPINTLKLKYEEFGMAMVGLAGPLSNFILAIAGGLVLRTVGTINSKMWVTFWVLFISINIGFFIFNLIPFPPLDGSRVLYAFSPNIVQRFMMQIEAFGFMAIIVFMFVIFPIISPVLQTINQSIMNFVIGGINI
jgi:Zn-dependent protease